METLQKIQACGITVLSTLITTMFLLMPLVSTKPPGVNDYYVGMIAMIGIEMFWFLAYLYYKEK